MRITSKNLYQFHLCPELYYSNVNIFEEENLLQKLIKLTIINTEQNCLLKDNNLTSRKLISEWNKLWWPNINKLKIDFSKAQKISNTISILLSKYNKQNINDSFTYKTIGTNINNLTNITSSLILETNVDILKYNTETDSLVICDINPPYKNNNIYNPYILSKIYPFRKINRNIEYISIMLNKKTIKYDIKHFRKNNKEQLNSFIKYLSFGIYNKVYYKNILKCDACPQKCKLK